MEFIKWGQKQVRQFALNLTETEVRVEEATNNEPWGPHGSDMARIAEDALDSEKYREIMAVIARRLTDTGENWRHVYKALLLLEHLIRHGPPKVSRDTMANSSMLHRLRSFEYKDKMGHDYGLNVRNRSKEILALVTDAQKLQEAREVARANRDKFCGASREHAKFMPSSPPPVFNQTLPKRVVYEEKQEDDVDPFEATRMRIEKLKASEKETTPKGAIKVTLPQQQKREPRKLSQVKVNPEIAATFVKPQATKPASVSSPQVPATTNAVDLIGDLTDVVPTGNVKREPDGHPDMFDILADPVAVSEAPSANDEWAAFNDGNKPSVQPEISLTDLLSHDQVSVPVMTAPSTMAPVSADPFATFSVTSQRPAMMSMGVPKPPTVAPTQSSPSGLTPDTSRPQWSTAAAVPQQHVKLGVDLQTNGMYGMGNPPATKQGARQGAPMNPNAVQPKRAPQKEDPFANLGF